MGQVHTVFTSEDKDVVAALKRQQTELIKLREKNKQLTDESKKGQRESAAAMNAGLGTLTQMASGLVSVQTLVGGITKAYSEWRAEQKKLADESTKFHQQLVKDLATTGDLGHLPQIERFLKSTGETREEGRAAFTGVTGAAQFATLERRFELTRAALGADPLGIDLQQFGSHVGHLAEAMPNATGENLADLALSMRQNASEHLDKTNDRKFLAGVRQLSAAGIDPTYAMGLGVATLDSELPAASLGKLAAAISDPTKSKQFGTDDPAARLDKLLTDPAIAQAVLGADTALKVQTIDADRARQLAQTFRHAQDTDLVSREVARLANPDSESGRVQLQADAAESDLERARMRDEADSRAWEQAWQFLEIQTRNEGANWLSRNYQKSQLATNATVNALLDTIGLGRRTSPEAAMYSGGAGEENIRAFQQFAGRAPEDAAIKEFSLSKVESILQKIYDALGGPHARDRPAVIEPPER